MSKPVILVLSHLRWGFVFQRPQHLLSRLAGQWQVYYVEEPVRCDGPAWLEERHVGTDLTVLVPHTPLGSFGFADDQLAGMQPLLETWLEDEGIRVDVMWAYTPMALPLAQAIPADCLIYDCMDELAAFKNAPGQLREREDELMRVANLVLTGGPSLYQAKRSKNPNVHCLPSAVDAAHFCVNSLVTDSAHAREAERLQADVPHPRLGFFGVIDERLDIDLLAEVADAHPDWHIVMAGPVVKIDPDRLPQRGNIHWLGMQPYERLPYLLAGWDLCLMPFALNESTRFISPTKTLEYMAGDKPVVSTPVRDVIALYGSAVEVAYGDGRAFVQACEKVLSERGSARFEREREMLAAVSTYSWDRSAKGVHELLALALATAQTPANDPVHNLVQVSAQGPAHTSTRSPAPASLALTPASQLARTARRAPVSANELRATALHDTLSGHAGTGLPATA